MDGWTDGWVDESVSVGVENQFNDRINTRAELIVTDDEDVSDRITFPSSFLFPHFSFCSP